MILMHPIYLMPWCLKLRISGHKRVNYSIPGIVLHSCRGWGGGQATLYLVEVVIPVLLEMGTYSVPGWSCTSSTPGGGPILYLVGVLLPVLQEGRTYSVPGWSCTLSTPRGGDLLCTWLELCSQYSQRELNYEPFFLHHPKIKITKVK